ncbi:hypothetical protein H0W91_02185 [Patescibacteria group bacterium]|nr:hypothetical protein [Patescibacteria group bacterium]
MIKESSYKIIYSIFIVLIVVFIGVYYKKTKTPLSHAVIEELSSSFPLDEKSPEDQLNILITRETVMTPLVKSISPNQENQFPKESLWFFDNNIIGLKTSTVNFEEEKSGLTADFSVSKNTRAVLESIVSKSTSNSWKVLGATFSKNAALIELENETYQASVQVTSDSEATSSVHIILIKK